MSVEYTQALVKFNGGKGALLCNNCNVIILEGMEHSDRKHFCCEECETEYNPYNEYYGPGKPID